VIGRSECYGTATLFKGAGPFSERELAHPLPPQFGALLPRRLLAPSSREARSRRTRAPASGGGDRVTPAAMLRLRGARLGDRPRLLRHRRGPGDPGHAVFSAQRIIAVMSQPKWPAYLAAGVIIAWGVPLVLLGFAPSFGGLDYNPEFDAAAAPMGLMLVYIGLYILKLTHPTMLWLGAPGIAQGCAASWIGFFAISTILAAMAALLGRRGFDLASEAVVWTVAVVIPFGLALVIQRVRRR